MTGKLYTLNDVATLVGVTTGRLDRVLKHGACKAGRPCGKRLVFSDEDVAILKEYFRQHKPHKWLKVRQGA